MRRLFIPACLCLATWSGALGPETPWPVEAAASSTLAKNKTKAPSKAEKESADSAAAATTGSAPAESPAPSLAAIKNAPAATEKKPDKAPEQAEHTASVTPVAAPVPNPVPKPPRKPVVHRSQREICDTLAKAAHTNNLPVPFFIRLLFQESRFEAGVVSHAGAQGIAQFMPETAASVGLDNPFDPLQAIPAAARLLRDLADQFGNLGLAAAAYNAGPDRVHKWLNKQERAAGRDARLRQDHHRTAGGKLEDHQGWSTAAAGCPGGCRARMCRASTPSTERRASRYHRRCRRWRASNSRPPRSRPRTRLEGEDPAQARQSRGVRRRTRQAP